MPAASQSAPPPFTDPTLPASSNRRLFTPWTLLGIALLTAWFPICRPYLRMGDDFHFSQWLIEHGVAVYFHENGVWRILGHELGNAATIANPCLQGILALITHGIGAMLFLAILRQLLVSKRLALMLALIFAIFPWGGEALMWACQYTYLLATTLFLAVLCLLLRLFPLRNSVAAPLCALCAALSLFAHEALFFALLISGALVFLRQDRIPPAGRLGLAAARVIGCAIWWILYKTFPGRIPVEHIRIHLRTLLSGIYYQYTNLWIFEPWKTSATRDLLFFGWFPWQFPIALLLLCAMALCVRQPLPPSTTPSPRPASAGNAMLIFLLLLVVAAVAIYSIGGGFSLDCRKKYPIIPVLLMALGCGIERFNLSKLLRPRIYAGALCALIACGIATTWLQIGLWRYEATRLDLLTDFLCTQPQPLSVRVDWDSRIQAAWPHANQYWGAPVEDFVRLNAVDLKRLLSPPVTYTPPVKAIKFDPVRFTWAPAH